MTQPTDGPWESTGTVIWPPSAKAVVACVSKLRPKSGMVEFEEPDVFDADLDEIMANRDLIVAAPSLRAALEAAIETAEFERHPYRPWHNQARAAIKQAKGETP